MQHVQISFIKRLQIDRKTQQKIQVEETEVRERKRKSIL